MMPGPGMLFLDLRYAVSGGMIKVDDDRFARRNFLPVSTV
jgi:hypothetical protein